MWETVVFPCPNPRFSWHIYVWKNVLNCSNNLTNLCLLGYVYLYVCVYVCVFKGVSVGHFLMPAPTAVQSPPPSSFPRPTIQKIVRVSAALRAGRKKITQDAWKYGKGQRKLYFCSTLIVTIQKQQQRSREREREVPWHGLTSIRCALLAAGILWLKIDCRYTHIQTHWKLFTHWLTG